MMEVETWPISLIVDRIRKTLLILDPEYQRREVWKKKNKVLFVDSIARSMPTGAITVFKDESEGFSKFEVIDGRQRMTALSEYIEDKFQIESSIIEAASSGEEIPTVESDLADRVIEAKKYKSLSAGDMHKFEEYEFPVFVINGVRTDAVNAFIRMNTNLYGLKPQEIRNAVFNQTALLSAACSICDDLTESYCESGEFFVNLGVVTSDNFTRMQDVQFVLECLILVMEGAQNRRDTIDKYCSAYSAPKGQLKKTMVEGIGFLMKAFSQVWQLTDGQALKSYHFPSNCENDLYALIGAFKERGLLSHAQLNNEGDNVIGAVSEFRRLVTLYSSEIGEDTARDDDYPAEVRDYAVTLLKGQINSDKRRKTRSDIMVAVINDVVDTIDKEGFSELQRSLIWANSVEKLCQRCGKKVTHKEYHAGHIKARAKGGKSVIQNGQVEHAKCNQSAGVG
jgi:hypothetical protein